MLTDQRHTDDGQSATDNAQPSPPAISLPKGGGAIRGMGEKFAANSVTGTGSMTVQIAASPGRSGFVPQLSLSYDSGAGNGPFGFGWSLSLPAITRKTDKGLPQYFDAEESDVFLLSGAEDLVPEFKKDNHGDWVMDNGKHVLRDEPRTVNDITYTVQRYRPRIEGLFARIERWTNTATGEIHWRSISRDNITTLYGKDNNSRIFDPADPDPAHPTRIFSWLICQSYDDKGNAIIYKYAAENEQDIDHTQANERNRVRTANRYLKHILYGNRTPNRDNQGKAIDPASLPTDNWMFEVVFDYGEHNQATPMPDEPGVWLRRNDPVSVYRAGFEVRTYRLCQRVLMFHHFPNEPEVRADCLVHSTDFTYSYEQDPDHVRNPVYTFLLAVTQTGYKRDNGGYLKRSLPPVEFEYSQPIVQDTVEEVEAESLENLPIGLDGAAYQWTDLHGEGIPGILTEQAGAWFYKRNLSPINVKPSNGVAHTEAKFAPVEVVATKPNLALAGGQAQFMDLAGDGQPDLVVLDGPMPGLYEHDGDEGWQPFRPFTSRLNRDTRDPNLKFVDLDGDGHADVLISEDDAFVWHPSLEEEGFGPARRVAQALDEEKGPRLVFADGTQSIYLADLSGDGLTDLVRVRNGEVCYWPNLGYGRFGAKVTMDHAPHFDNPDQFDHQRIRLADIDGTGTTDLIYLHRDGVHLYFNQSGNSWSAPQPLRVFPHVDDLVSITPTDLLGNGTACLVWSSPLPGDARRPMRYVNLTGRHKPHLLVKVVNNLGAETRVQYVPSTKFYLQDKRDGKPWITRLPFPVHVVERVETYDHISRNRFVTRYAYHHGYFDGEEREFRGFGMVEQWDTEEIAALTADGALSEATNLDAPSHVPPVHTKTWFHTGVYLDREHISRQFEGEYYREPGLDDQQFRAQLLPDTTLPIGLTLKEEREACRALKGMMLRQEVYADDAPPGSSQAMIQRARTPYTVVEQDFTIRPLQPSDGNRHAVFFIHPCEVITYHDERNPADPRIQHALTLEVDEFGNVLKEAAIGYGRRETIRVVDHLGVIAEIPNPGLNELGPNDQKKQTRTLITYIENRVAKDPITGVIDTATDYRTPLPCETLTYELTGYTPTGAAGRFQSDDFVQPDPAAPDGLKLVHILDSEIEYEDQPTNGKQRRLIEHVRTLYRKDDLTALLPLGELEALALPGESYKLVFTPGLRTQVFQRDGQALLPNPVDVLAVDAPGNVAADRGGYVDLDGDDHWWIPSGRVFLSPNSNATPAQELGHARQYFFLPHRYRDPFHTDGVRTESFVSYDAYDLLIVETRDALGNVVTVATLDDDGNTARRINYRVLQPYWVTDPNGNRTQVAFDALGMVVGTAVMGKATEPDGKPKGDSLEGFEPDLTQTQLDAFLAQPREPGASPSESAATQIVHDLLGKATTRIVYDLHRYKDTANSANPQPVFAATIARETHVTELSANQHSKLQVSFSYSDGFGREIQQKIQAEPGPLVEGGPVVSPRWVASGWTVFNNKSNPIRQYEPFFTDTHRFEFDVKIGVSPVLFYDPVERVVATLHPNHTWEKVVFDPWQQETWDVNDTVLVADPKADPDVGDFFRRLPATDYLLSWHSLRTDPTSAVEANWRWPDPRIRDAERNAANSASLHANTPTIAHFDSLGRTFLTFAHNGFELDGTPILYGARVHLDIEGNQREVVDALNRVVMRYDYDMLGNRIHQASMETGERWTLNDVTGNPIRSWDSRGHHFKTEYDALRRPFRRYVRGTDANHSDPQVLNKDVLFEKIEYGEGQPDDIALNLRTRVFRQYDSAGILTNMGHNPTANRDEAYDFKGNLQRSTRRLTVEFKTVLDWSGNPGLEAEVFSSSTCYDALNRPIQVIAPHSNLPNRKINILQPVYNEANLLERLEAWLQRPDEPNELLDPATTDFRPVVNLDYDAKGQRTLIEYEVKDAAGNQRTVRTEYRYDRETFRLLRLRTARPHFPVDQQVLQDVAYIYDPAGNITHLHDGAQQSVFFNGAVVDPHNEYFYDAIYRLIQAKGREHVGQVSQPETSWNDQFRVTLAHPHDGQAMRPYTERYEYDPVGNILAMKHQAAPFEIQADGSWTRSYDYREWSLLEAGKFSNRLTSTTVRGQTSPYTHDAHGNMMRMNHLPLMRWDYRDQLRATSQQVVNNGGTPEITWYVYDAAGQRVRKVTERQASAGQTPKRKEKRIYLGGFEIYRQYENDGDAVALERETLHIIDDKQRIALVETKTLDSSSPLTPHSSLIRYQFGNHLGSSSLELDDQARIISYEEYTPYGSTSYQAVRSQTETQKRYRYTGKERDEENGLYYYETRYYAAWVARWVSADPKGMVGWYKPVRLCSQ